MNINSEKGKSSIFAVLIILILVIISIVAIRIIIYKKDNKTNLTAYEETQENIQNNEIITNNTERENIGLDTYIGIGGYFIGSYENGKWYNTQEVEELQYKPFSIENIKQQFPKFYYHRYGEKALAYEDYIQEDERTFEDGIFKFKLPPDILEGDEQYLEVFTNNKEEVFTTKNDYLEITEDYDSIINSIKQENMVLEAKTEITEIIKADYDKDNENEIILIVNNQYDENGYSICENGVCSLVVVIDDDKSYEVVHKFIITEDQIENVNMMTEYSITSVLICDLNSDGKNEMCINVNKWEASNILIYEFDEKFKLVLNSEIVN